jgi:hypothetical protein
MLRRRSGSKDKDQKAEQSRTMPIDAKSPGKTSVETKIRDANKPKSLLFKKPASKMHACPAKCRGHPAIECHPKERNRSLCSVSFCTQIYTSCPGALLH